ncbi:MAG TPA: site-2 protease family protein [Phycisphaerae bacterium]|nr:site-2 protease family protein [Phycisphaerae bacterium]
MDSSTIMCQTMLAAIDDPSWLAKVWSYIGIFAGFSFIIFVHELGHFAVAKWSGVRVEQFAIGFFREIFGFTKGETRYSFNLLPLGGYVKMLGQEDFEVDTTGELQYRDDPRSFANKPVGVRMAIVSAGVIMNLLLSLTLFIIIFSVGKRVQSPRVGATLPGRPAAAAGILSGDVIKSINGSSVDEFQDIPMTVMLAKPGEPLEFVVERDGELMTINVVPEVNASEDIFQIGITSPQIATLVNVGPGYDPENPKHPRPGDTIVAMGDTEVTKDNANSMLNLLATDPLKYDSVVVERLPIDAPKDAKPERVSVDLEPRIALRRLDMVDPSLYGLVPLARFSSVDPGGRADLAGIEVGDIILQWGDIENPTALQIEKSILKPHKSDWGPAERDIPVKLLKHDTGKVVNKTVRPKIKVVPLLRIQKGKPTIGAQFEMLADGYLRVASVVETTMDKETPAAQAGIPVNAMITKVNDKPVKSWVQLAEAFRKNAGSDVVVSYDLGAEKDLTATMSIPRSLRSILGVGPEASIISVNGEERIKVERNGISKVYSVNYPVALYDALKASVGETAEIQYRPGPLSAIETKSVEVTEDMLVPWVGATAYTVDVIAGGETMVLRKTNPIDAVRLGVKKTYFFVMQVYQVIERMIVSRTLGVDKISGPVGIVDIGSKMARGGFIDLLWFLALISANLAVINFLPLPIVDGGLMVFLIIEKIKGSPISVRVQVATQVIGLVLIATAFLYVTLNDLAG